MGATTTIDKMTRGLDRLPPVFACCLAESGNRFAIDRVFTRDGFVYATNGRMVVRMPAPEGWDVPNGEGRYPDVGLIFDGKFRPDPVALPAIAPDPCPACKGSRFLAEQDCPRCEGGGEVECDCDCPHCDYAGECDDCGGTGILEPGPCLACMRTGFAGEGKGVSLGEVSVQDRYLAILVHHGASLYLMAGKPQGQAIRFVVGDVEGRLMPMVRDR